MKEGKNLNIWLAMSILLLVMACTATGKIIYVDANGGNNGSRANFQPDVQYPSIQAAIDAAVDGDTIILAPGTFRGDGNRDIDFKGKAITVRGTDPNDPDIVAATIIDCNGTKASPHRGFYFHSGEDANSILAGVTIMNGHAEDGGGVYCESSSPTLRKCNFMRNSAQGFEDCSGGGMYNYRSSPTLVDCTFSGNSAFALFHGGGSGGGMHNRDSSPTLTTCTFENNSTAWAGGGMRNSYYSTPTLSNCTFGGNSADCGGGMDNDYHSNPTLTNCTFSGNSAVRGGGVHNDRVSPMLTNCTFSGNSASYSGGGMENYNDKYNQCSPTLINCTFAYNRATKDGGGISNLRSNPTLTNCTLRGNSAEHGAGMYIYFGGNPILTNCLLIGNTASNFGGGISAIHNSSLKLNNCTFVSNSATNGNALACYHRHQQHLPSDVQITNSILWDGGNEIWNNNGSEFTIRYSDVQDGWPGEGNINADPLLVHPGVGENFRLSESSPCIDAGDPDYIAEPNETDFDGKPRVVGGRIDMGPFEFQGRLIVYVDNDAAGSNNGSSWDNAYKYLQDALIAAEPISGRVEIRVAEGLYKPDQGAGVMSGDQTASFRVKRRVAVKGGYAGFGHPEPNVRDVEAYETILSGDLAGDDGPNFANIGENSYHVVTSSARGETTILDGFTITAGNAANGSDGQGGGIRLSEDYGFTITNCTIIRNRAQWSGGGMHSGGSSSCCCTITNCRFISNSAGWGGGGLFLDGESLPRMTNCIFVGNSAVTGGAIYNYEGYPRIVNCTFSDNRASDECGGVFDLDSISNFKNCILWANTDKGGSDESAQIGWSNPQYINFSCIQGWTGVLGGTGNIDADPCFADPGYWYPNGTPADANDDFWIGGDYYLKSQAGRWNPSSDSWVQDDVTSPCIDAGNPMAAIGPEPFPNGGIINMGAYGGTAEASKSYFGEPVCETIVAGDINGDCKVNFLDFRLMALHWLEDNTPVSAVTTTYLFQPDPNALRTSGGFTGQGHGSYCVEGQFELTVDFCAGVAWFNRVDANTSCGESTYRVSLDALFHMSELVSTDVSEAAIDFVFEKNIPSFPLADVHLQVIFLDGSVQLVGSVCDAICDGYCFHLDAVAVAEP